MADPVLQVWNAAEAALEEALNATGREWEVSGAVRCVCRGLAALCPQGDSSIEQLLSLTPFLALMPLCLQMNPGDGAFYGGCTFFRFYCRPSS